MRKFLDEVKINILRHLDNGVQIDWLVGTDYLKTMIIIIFMKINYSIVKISQNTYIFYIHDSKNFSHW